MRIQVEISGLGHAGEGIGRVNGLATFIPGALPGETVLAEIKEKKKKYQRGIIAEVLKHSPRRIDAPCSVFEDCGGCQLQHLDYAASLEWKQQRVKDVLERIAKLPEVNVQPVLGMSEPWRYRNKVQLQAGSVDGKFILGYYSSKTNRLVPFIDCLLLPGLFNELKVFLEQEISSCPGKSWPEQVVIRYSDQTGEVMLGIVGQAPQLDWHSILERFPQLKSIVLFDSKDREVMLLAGESTIQDQIFGSEFALSFQSFTQVNPKQTGVLYSKVLEYAGLTGNETVIDVYCGIGTITLALARKAKSVIGIEIVEQAIADARKNAKKNNLKNVEFYAAPAEKILPQLASRGLQADVIVVDPPRAGCDKGVLDAIIKMAPERIVYVSCDPATLARDLGLLKDRGYIVMKVQPIDMFPWTVHVETVCCIKKTDI